MPFVCLKETRSYLNALLANAFSVFFVDLKSLTLIGSAIAEVLFIIYSPTALNVEAVAEWLTDGWTHEEIKND